jgi:hypothetical protein
VIRLMPLSLTRIFGQPRIEIGLFLRVGTAARYNRDLPRNWFNLYAGNTHASGEHSLHGAQNVGFRVSRWMAHQNSPINPIASRRKIVQLFVDTEGANARNNYEVCLDLCSRFVPSLCRLAS